MKNIDKVIKTILFSVRHVYTLYTPIIPYLNLYIIIIYNYMILFSDLRIKTQGVQEPWTLDNLREILIHSFRLCVILWKPPTINMAAPQESAQGVNKALSLMYITFLFEIQFNLNIILSIVLQTNSWIWKSHCPVNPRRLSNGYIEASLC